MDFEKAFVLGFQRSEGGLLSSLRKASEHVETGTVRETRMLDHLADSSGTFVQRKPSRSHLTQVVGPYPQLPYMSGKSSPPSHLH